MSLLLPDSIEYINKQYHFERMSATIRGVACGLSWITQNRSQALSVYAKFSPQFDLGLYAFQSESPFGSFSSYAVKDEEFMGIFTISCAQGDVENAEKVLSAKVRAELRTLARLGSAVLADDGVRCLIQPGMMTGPELAMVVEACVNIAEEVGRLKGQLSAPTLLRENGVAAALTATAQGLDLTVEQHPFSIHGASTHSSIQLQFQTQFVHRLFDGVLAILRARPGYHLQLRFAEPLGLALRLRTASLFDRAQSALGFKDLQVGDAEFDRRWTIHAKHEERARAVLHAQTQSALNTLADLGLDLALDDQGLTGVGSLLKRPNDAEKLLQIISELYQTLQPRVVNGPYR